MGQKALQVHVSRLRRLLGGDRIGPGPRLRNSGRADELDAERFERLAGEGTRPAREALALGGVAARRRSPTPLRAAGDRPPRGSAADLSRGTDRGRSPRRPPHESTGELEALVAEPPLRERLRAPSMVALYRSGRRPRRSAAYQEARGRWSTSSGSSRAASSASSHQRMLNQDPALDVHGGAAEAAATPAGNPAIGDRLRMLSGQCRRVLSLASVLGQEFGLVALERVADDTGIDRRLWVLDEAHRRADRRAGSRLAGSAGLRRCPRSARRCTGRFPPRTGRACIAAWPRRSRRSTRSTPEPHRAEVAFDRALAEQG